MFRKLLDQIEVCLLICLNVSDYTFAIISKRFISIGVGLLLLTNTPKPIAFERKNELIINCTIHNCEIVSFVKLFSFGPTYSMHSLFKNT